MGYITKQERLLQQIRNSGTSSLGACGGVLINDTAAHARKFSAFTVIAEAVLDSSEITSKIQDLDVDVTVPAGITIFGNFSNLQLVSGTIIAYFTC
jgi:hypothetical protein